MNCACKGELTLCYVFLADDWREVHGILQELWFKIPFSTLSKLRKDKRFPNYPDTVNYLNTDMDAPTVIEENYGQRLTA